MSSKKSHKKRNKKLGNPDSDNPNSDNINPEFPIVPSPYDPRDFKYETVKQRTLSNVPKIVANSTVKSNIVEVNVPDTLDLRTKMLIPRNQGQRGTCAAFASSAIKEYQECIDRNFQDYMSPDFIYFYRENKPSAGMYCRDVMKILQKNGSVPENMLPYDDTKEPDTIPQNCIVEAEKSKISTYARISTIQELKEALCRCGPCLIAFPVYATRPEFWRPLNVDDKSVGGHAVCVVGYTKDAFIIRNSWGHKWNNDGYVMYPFSEFGKHWEVWCCTDIDSDEWLPNPSTTKKCMRFLGGVFSK